MKQAKLLGYTLKTEHLDAHTNQYQDHDEGGIYYTFYVLIGDILYIFTAEDTYGSCGSGYCSASWGYIDFTLSIYTQELPELHIPKEDIFININDDNKIIVDIRDSYDSTIETLNSLSIRNI